MANESTIDVRDLIFAYERQISLSKLFEDSLSFEFNKFNDSASKSILNTSHTSLNVSVSRLKDIFENKSNTNKKETMNSKKRKSQEVGPRRKKQHLMKSFELPIANSTLFIDVSTDFSTDHGMADESATDVIKYFETKKSATRSKKILEEPVKIFPKDAGQIQKANTTKNREQYQGAYTDKTQETAEPFKKLFQELSEDEIGNTEAQFEKCYPELYKDSFGIEDKQFEQLYREIFADEIENVDENFANMAQNLQRGEIQSAEEVFQIILRENTD